LWEQGFYGKGTLSRSEPSWLDREKTKRGNKGKSTSEDNTRKRRAERQQTKWERARKEREAIDEKLLEEAAAAVQQREELNHVVPVASTLVEEVLDTVEVKEPIQMESKSLAIVDEILEQALERVESPVLKPAKLGWAAPVGPLELLSLPNSDDELTVACFTEDFDDKYVKRFFAAPVGPMELLALPNSLRSYEPPKLPQHTLSKLPDTNPTDFPFEHESVTLPDVKINGNGSIAPNALGINGHTQPDEIEVVGGSETNEDTIDESIHSDETTETNGTPANGSTLANSRPSTPKVKRQKSVRFSPTVEKNTFIQSEPPSPERAVVASTSVVEEPLEIKNQEHLQLTLEEAFFLSYALGAISIFDPETKAPIPNQDLFYLLRKTSYFPPQLNPALSPDDPFMMNYVVYHHYRSLGWVVRSGIKFSVDYMLYNRGPVFSHAEFGVLILPSYSDPYWTSDPFLEKISREKQKRTWAWMSCINRVITQVKKTLILTYVDVPKLLSVQEEQDLGIDGVLSRYKVREIVMKRFAANRMRD
jgi:tRNA-splicing endonuclease subunit Sen2